MGYSIRLESKRSFRTKILVCTTGPIVSWLVFSGLQSGQIWSSSLGAINTDIEIFWKGRTLQKPRHWPADVFRIKQKLSWDCWSQNLFHKETRYDSNINKLGTWTRSCICCLHEFSWIWHTAVEEVCFSDGWKMILNYTMWRISLSTNVVSSGNILVWKVQVKLVWHHVSWRAHAKSEEHFSSWFCSHYCDFSPLDICPCTESPRLRSWKRSRHGQKLSHMMLCSQAVLLW